jgi:hypothetical protein
MLFANTQVYHVEGGWNLLGNGLGQSEINVTKFGNFGIPLVWAYRNGQWWVFSPNGAYNSAINSSQYSSNILSEIKAGEGFWLLSPNVQDINISASSGQGGGNGGNQGGAYCNRGGDWDLSEEGGAGADLIILSIQGLPLLVSRKIIESL